MLPTLIWEQHNRQPLPEPQISAAGHTAFHPLGLLLEPLLQRRDLRVLRRELGLEITERLLQL